MKYSTTTGNIICLIIKDIKADLIKIWVKTMKKVTTNIYFDKIGKELISKSTGRKEN